LPPTNSLVFSVGGINLAPTNRKLDGKRHQLRPPEEVAAMKAARDLVVGEGVLVRPTVRSLVVRLPHDNVYLGHGLPGGQAGALDPASETLLVGEDLALLRGKSHGVQDIALLVFEIRRNTKLADSQDIIVIGTVDLAFKMPLLVVSVSCVEGLDVAESEHML